MSTVERYLQALGARLVIDEHIPSLANTAVSVRAALAASGPEDALRHAIQFIDDVARLDEPARSSAIRDEPDPTSSPQWDALLAGVAEYVALTCGARVPGWTAAPSRFLSTFWFVIEDILGRPANGLATNAFVNSPALSANRGVYLDRRTLVSV